MNRLFGHLRELGLNAVHQGTDKFIFDPFVYTDTVRCGFGVRDELEVFCWLSDSLFWPNPNKMSITVKVPERLFWEYWSDRLSYMIDEGME